MRLVSKTRFATSMAVVLLIVAGTILIINKINKEPMDKIIQQENIVLQTKETSTPEQEEIPITIPNKVEETKVYYDVPLSEELQDFIRDTCIKYDVDMEIMLGIMYIESAFKQDVQSQNQSEHGNSIGICQLNENYIEWYKQITNNKNFNIYDVKNNIEGGIAVYKYYYDYWRDKGFADNELTIRSLNSYNCGIAIYNRIINNTQQISRGYDQKVLDYSIKFR